MTNLIHDTSVAAKRYVLANVDTGELGNDEFLTADEARQCNDKLRSQGKPWRWLPWMEKDEDQQAA